MTYFVGSAIVAVCAAIVLRARVRKVNRYHGRKPSNHWFV